MRTTTIGLTISPRRIAIILGLWLVAEFCAFTLVVSIVGWGGAIILGLLTSLIGVSQLRRLGKEVALSLRKVLGPRGITLKQQSVVDGTIAAIGGVLLILPGFLSDLLGLALAAPSIRFWLTKQVKRYQPAATSRRPRRPRDQVIDLNAADWQRVDDVKPKLHSGG